MRKKRIDRCILMLVLVFSLLCTACGKQEVTSVEASDMSLVRAEGTVGISDEEGEKLSLRDDMKLYSGYALKTEKESFAWMNLDSVKLAKMDSASEARIQKKGKDLELLAVSGNLFFHITEPLEEDETMNIRNSTMTVGIRGTCGWVEVTDENHMSVYILEGKVESCIEEPSGEKETADVSAWEKAEMVVDENGKGIITVEKFTESDIPDFVRTELDEMDFPLSSENVEELGEDFTDGSVDLDAYVGSYICDEKGHVLTISVNRGYYTADIQETVQVDEETPLIASVPHTLKAANGILYAIGDGEVRWTMTPQDGQLIVGDCDVRYNVNHDVDFNGIYHK